MDANDKCSFYEQLAILLDTAKYYKSLSLYKAALVDEGYYKQIDADHYCGRAIYHFDKLNYCPICGAKINVKEAKK